MRQLLAGSPHSDVAINAIFLRENVGETADEAYAFGMRRMAYKRVELNKQTEKLFVAILLRAARAHEDVSREVREFIRRF